MTIEKAIERLASSLRFVRDEQAHMYVRDKVHNRSKHFIFYDFKIIYEILIQYLI